MFKNKGIVWHWVFMESGNDARNCHTIGAQTKERGELRLYQALLLPAIRMIYPMVGKGK
ncbi:MAG: hypothetical protein MESAZ_00035 [Saezia sanguinis]